VNSARFTEIPMKQQRALVWRGPHATSPQKNLKGVIENRMATVCDEPRVVGVSHNANR
jgi:hypothetical protein